MFIENATKNIGFVSCQLSVAGRGGGPSVARDGGVGDPAERGVVSCSLPGSGAEGRRFSSVEGVGQGVVRLREAVAGGVSREAGNGRRSRKVAKPQKKHAKNSMAVFEFQRPGNVQPRTVVRALGG